MQTWLRYFSVGGGKRMVYAGKVCVSRKKSISLHNKIAAIRFLLIEASK